MVEKLALQVDSFQEGFKILSESKSLEEMAQQFVVLLRGNFLITKVYVFYRQSVEAEWEVLQGKQDYIPKLLDKCDHNRMQIHYDLSSSTKVCISLPLVDKSLFGITIGNRLDRSDFSEFDRLILQIFLQLLNNAYQSFISRKKEKGLIFELNEKVFQLNNLIDTGIELSRFKRHHVLFELALERIVSITNSASALILIKDKRNKKIIDKITFPGNISADIILKSKLKIESSFVFNEISYLCVLSEKETRNGTTSFSELDELLLQAITKQVNASIENEYLLKQSLEKERIEKEISLAASIQQRIIPTQLPKIEGYELTGINIPSREVGGDYYDCIDIGNGKYALIIADVAGKGISAALLVSTLNAALYSYLEFDLPLSELADKLNKLIFQSSPSDKFITFFIAILNVESGEINTLNAGHNPILLLRKDGKLEQIEAVGIGLGMLDFGITYEGKNLILNNGDQLFLYTDGIPEAMNINEEEYSDQKMIDFFHKHSNLSTNDFITSLVADVKSFTGDAPQSDDITMFLLKKR